MPFAPDDPDGPRGFSSEKLQLPLDTPGWQRCFYARHTASGQIIGHVDMKSDGLKTALHRCEPGIGIEKDFRGKGLGKQLMNTAIEFARNTESSAWIDLRVFAHNTKARALYLELGCSEVGVLKDRFQINGELIDDIIMVLDVASG